MRLFMVQHGLERYSGHYYPQSQAMVQMVREWGIPYKLYIHQNALPQIVAELDGRAIFSHSPGLTCLIDKPCRKLYSFLHFARAFERDCQAITQDGITSDDALLVLYGDGAEMQGVAWWLASLPEERRPKVFFHFHIPDFTWKFDQNGQLRGETGYHCAAGKLLSSLLPTNRIFLSATNSTLAQAISVATGLHCAYASLGIPLPVPEPLCSSPTFNVGVIGGWRPEKGNHLVVDALHGFSHARPGSSLFLHLPDRQTFDQLTPLLQQFGPDTEFTIRLGDIKKDFVKYMRKIDILLLPYQPNRYRMRISGIMAEGIALGLIAVVPANTWMAEQITQGHGVGKIFHDYNHESAALALIEAYDNIKLLKQQATSLRQPWIRRHGVESWMSWMLEQATQKSI